MNRDAWWFRAFLVGIAALGPFSLNVFSPCLPFIRSELHVSLATVQLSASLSILAAAVATATAGLLADSFGRRPVLLATLGVYVVASAAAAVAPHIGVLIVGRLLQAASSSVAFITARALIHDVYGAARSPSVIARISLLTVVAVVVAPLASGLVIERASWRVVFALTSVVGLVLFAVALARITETSTTRARPSLRVGLDGVRTLLRAPHFHGFAMPSALHFAVFFAFTMTASHLMVGHLHQTARGYGVWFVLLSVAVGTGLGAADVLSRRISAARIALLGSSVAFVGACVSAYFLLDGALTPARLFAPVAICALGIGLAVPATNAGVMTVRPELSGTASGLMGFEQYVLAAIFAQLAAHDEDTAARSLALLALAGCAGALAFGGLAAGEPRPARVEAAP